jgi:hypothetical protein
MFKKLLFVFSFFLLLSSLSFSPVFALTYEQTFPSGESPKIDTSFVWSEPVTITNWGISWALVPDGTWGSYISCIFASEDLGNCALGQGQFEPLTQSGTVFKTVLFSNQSENMISTGDLNLEMKGVRVEGFVDSDSSPFVINQSFGVPGGGSFNPGVNSAVNGAVLGASISTTSVLAWIIPIAIIVLISITLVIWLIRKFKKLASLRSR